MCIWSNRYKYKTGKALALPVLYFIMCARTKILLQIFFHRRSKSSSVAKQTKIRSRRQFLSTKIKVCPTRIRILTKAKQLAFCSLTNIQIPEIKFRGFVYLCANQDSNLGPLEYQSSALPAELFAHIYKR